MTQATEISNPPAEARRQGVPLWRSIAASTALQSMVPVVVALIVGAIIILMFGNDPLKFYSMVFKRGLLSWVGLQEVLTRMAPLLLIAAGLIFCYRAGVWNLGMDGQFLIGAVLAAYFAVPLAEALPRGVALGAACAIGALAGATQTIIPAWLKIRYGTNEIVTSLMMSLLGLSLTSWLIKGPMHDPNSTAVQTVTLPVEDRFPRLFDTYVSSALLLGFVAIVVAHFVMSRTAFGLRLSMVGANASEERPAHRRRADRPCGRGRGDGDCRQRPRRRESGIRLRHPAARLPGAVQRLGHAVPDLHLCAAAGGRAKRLAPHADPAGIPAGSGRPGASVHRHQRSPRAPARALNSHRDKERPRWLPIF